MSEPFYSCSQEGCAEECSYPADMLNMYEGEPVCEGCWDDMPIVIKEGSDDCVYWGELEKFVPAHEIKIAELEAHLADTLESQISMCKDAGKLQAQLSALREPTDDLLVVGLKVVHDHVMKYGNERRRLEAAIQAMLTASTEEKNDE